MKEAEIILAVVLLGGLAVATAVGIIVASALIGPRRRRSKTKFDTYECGVPLLDSARRRFSIKFYLVGLIFMLFDIETVFLIPWAVKYEALGVVGLVEALAFLAVLVLGLVYIWKRGALDWD
ncbi:MAG: NADH-quinone oxidoreductase subunit A [Planctomycetota bacterium]|jgi:NADH-quinone oxidoreductase subunit A